MKNYYLDNINDFFYQKCRLMRMFIEKIGRKIKFFNISNGVNFKQIKGLKTLLWLAFLNQNLSRIKSYQGKRIRYNGCEDE